MKDTTSDFGYPGQDQYLANHFTQNTWWIRATGPTDTAKQGVGQQGTYTVATNVFYALNAGTMFPEYYANPANWPPPNEGEGYAVAHALNCANTHGSYGWSTYWFDDATISSGLRRAVPSESTSGSKDLLDEKATELLAERALRGVLRVGRRAARDADVIDAITGNDVSPIYDAGSDPVRAAPRARTASSRSASRRAAAGNTLHHVSATAQRPCANVFSVPERHG